MPTYKDVDEIRKEILQGEKNLHFKNAENAEICAGVLAFVEGVIDRVPEADIEPVKHGHWGYGEERNGSVYAYCTACHRKMNFNCYGYPHCSLCGAKMGGKEVQE